MHDVDEGNLELQPRRLLDPDGLAEAGHDRGFVLVNGEEERAPFQCGEEDDDADDGQHRALHEPDEAGGKMRTVDVVRHNQGCAGALG